MSGVLCPKCKNTDEATMWDDNFWSGCHKCGWMESCENAIWAVDPNQPGVLVDIRQRNPYNNYRDDE